MSASTRFTMLEQTAFQQLEHAGYLKGLLKPFKGKGALEVWASQCEALRDDLIVLAQARSHPFNLLPTQLAQQTTGAGTTFLRWRNLDRSSMGVALWQEMMVNPATPPGLISDLHAIEVQRAVLNMQISLLHTLTRQARDCASKLVHADEVYLRRTGHQADLSQPHPGEDRMKYPASAQRR